jgi:peptide/nickel transport system ATP-binding protein
VEHGPVGEVFTRPRHEYTQALLDAAPGKGWAFGAGSGMPPADAPTGATTA